MKRIGILSDTHSYWDEKYLHYFEPCDEIWHAGDIGSVEVAERLAAFRPFRAVCGNCDGGDLRLMYRELHSLCQSAAVVCGRTLAHPQGEVRQDTQHAAHQSRCRRAARVA